MLSGFSAKCFHQIKRPELNVHELIFYRDRLREARYAALADSEEFGQICFVIESLGLRLLGKEATLHKYESCIAKLSANSTVFTDLPKIFPSKFKSFGALFDIVRAARNDAIHLGAYARHATVAAIELCIGLEEVLMANVERTAGNLMVTSPVVVEPWQPIAQVRQLMLMHSFSFLPLRMSGAWWLLSELGMAKYLGVRSETKKQRLGCAISDAVNDGLELLQIKDEDLLDWDMSISDVLKRAAVQGGSVLWLVIDKKQPSHLVGILTPFELM